MKMIVGLGNPGDEYKNTRHNIGYMFIDHFANKYNVSFDKKKFNGLYTELLINGEKVVLIKPLSYMNLSGEVVSRFVKFYKLDIKDLLIINDDLDLPLGKIRLRESGSSGGHNGLKNIALHLGTEDFKRLKIGISNDRMMDTKDYVLGKFSKEDMNTLENLKETVDEIQDDFIKMDFDKLMNKYNKK